MVVLVMRSHGASYIHLQGLVTQDYARTIVDCHSTMLVCPVQLDFCSVIHVRVATAT